MIRPGGHFSRIGLIAVMVGLLVALAASSAAAAKADRLYPVAQSYSPGDTATMVGYVNQATHGERRALFIESLSVKSPDYPADVRRIEVGTVEVSQTPNKGRHSYRVFAEFVVPLNLEPGVYNVVYDFNDGLIGDLEASKLRVGVEPNKLIRRDWALDEPEILNLAPGALIKVPGGFTTATDIRTGAYFAARADIRSGPLGTRNIHFAQPPEDISVATVGLELPETPLAVEVNSIDAEEAGANAGWILAVAVVAFLVLTAADARDRRLNGTTREGPAN